MTKQNNAVGAYGERLACRYLLDLGYEVLAQNWRCPQGEIDIVATDPQGNLAIVEVKTRRTDDRGTGAQAVTSSKLARLRRLCAVWLGEHPHHGRVRIDVISILLPLRGTPAIDHFTGVAW